MTGVQTCALPIYKYFMDRKWLIDMADCEDIAEFVNSDRIIEMIQSGDKNWMKHIPPKVAEMIKKEDLFQLSKKQSR